MRVVTITVAKDWSSGNQPVKDLRLRRLRTVDSLLPWPSEFTSRSDQWVSPNSPIRLDVVTNEPERTGPLVTSHRNGEMLSWAGYLDERTLLGGTLSTNEIADLSGIFALVSAAPAEVRAYTNVHRMEQLYWAEGRSHWVISTSPRVAHAYADIRSDEPPVAALASLVSAGFMLSDTTPFPSVKAVPASCEITIDRRGPRFKEIPLPDIDPDADPQIQIEGLTNALLGAGVAATSDVENVEAHLTGGRDSRIVASVLSSLGVQASYSTLGFEADPDVVVARELAQVLSVDHHVGPPPVFQAEEGAVVVDPLDRMYENIRATGGQIWAWDGLGAHYQYSGTTPVLGGHGGELLRAGYAFHLGEYTVERAQRKVRWLGSRARTAFTPDVQHQVDAMLEPWLDAVAADPVSGLSRMYRELRTGRWLAVAWSAYSMEQPRRSLLADNRVARWSAACDQHRAVNEELVHGVIHKLTPELCDVRFVGSRWEFEVNSPSETCRPASWEKRAPYKTTKKTQSFNWRLGYQLDMHASMVRTIKSSRVSKLFNGSDLDSLLEGASNPSNQPKAKALWSIFSAAVVAGPKWGRKFHGRDFSIAVPDIGPHSRR